MKLLATAVLAWAFAVGGVSAQNGLERFEREIKPQIQLERFDYRASEPLGEAGFVLSDVVAVVPASPSTGDQAGTLRIDRLTVEAIDFDRLKDIADDELPRFARLRVEGMSGDEEMFAALTPYAIPRVPVDMVLDYRLDGETGHFTLNRLDVALRGLAKVGLSFVMEGVSEKSSEVGDAVDDGRLRSASLTIDDSGLLARLLPSLALEQGQTAEGMVAIALVTLAALSDGQGAATLQALDAIASFVGDWRAPKGTLVVKLAPASTASLSDIDRALEPDALVDIFGLSASYPATREGAAKAGPAAK